MLLRSLCVHRVMHLTASQSRGMAISILPSLDGSRTILVAQFVPEKLKRTVPHRSVLRTLLVASAQSTRRHVRCACCHSAQCTQDTTRVQRKRHSHNSKVHLRHHQPSRDDVQTNVHDKMQPRVQTARSQSKLRPKSSLSSIHAANAVTPLSYSSHMGTTYAETVRVVTR